MSSVSNYDDTSIFTPEGRVKPLEYIKNTVELGNITIALCNGNIGVIIVHTGPVNPLNFQPKKIFKISESSLFSFSGITNDGLEIVDYLIRETIWHEIYKHQEIDHFQLFRYICTEASYRTITTNKRLYGAGGVLMAREKGKVVLIEFDPTGILSVVKAMSIGSRSQSAKTILENHVDEFREMDKNRLIEVGIKALKNAHPDVSLSCENVEIWVLEENISVVDAKNFI